MATKAYLIGRGQRAQDVVESAGSVVGAETMSLNIDFTLMTRGEAVELLSLLQERLLERPWPPS